jgi:hypothetical protein
MRARNAVFAVTMTTVCFAIVTSATPSFGETEQAHQRQTARGVRQDTRQTARDTKQNCVVANQTSNAQCRQNKRETKQTGRQVARDIKY